MSKPELKGAAKMRANFVVDNLSRGSAEYYHKEFSITIDWNGKFDFTFIVTRNSDKAVLETTIVTHTLADEVVQEPPLLVVWDKAVDELDRLKTKYILDYNGDLDRHPGTAAPMEE